MDGTYLFNIGTARIHAGGMAARLMKKAHSTDSRWDLVINLTGNSQMNPTVMGFNGAGAIAKGFIGVTPTYPGYPELSVEWPDGRVPDIRRKEWRRLVEDLKVFNGDVLIHCIGGHGRTGTLLVILGSLSGALKDVDPVLWVRNKYCVKTVETEAQILYLKKNMQIKTEQPARYLPYVAPVATMAGSVRIPTPTSWWTREEQQMTGYGNFCAGLETPREDLSGTVKCTLCMQHKKKILMHTSFMDGTGTCLLCDTDATAMMYERY